jgi:cold shock CspA family protein
MIRLFNNTSLETDFMLELNKHLIVTQFRADQIESVTMNQESMDIFGIDCLLGTVSYTDSPKVQGSIRWFDESSGRGVIRLDSGASVTFYSCNCSGADSLYPELVTTVQFTAGERVEGTVSADAYTFNSIGLTYIRKIGG